MEGPSSKPKIPPLPLDRIPVRHPPLKTIVPQPLKKPALPLEPEKPSRTPVVKTRSSCLTVTSDNCLASASTNSAAEDSVAQMTAKVSAAEAQLRRLLTAEAVDPAELRTVIEGVLGVFELLANNADLAERRWNQSTDSLKRLEGLALDQLHEQGKFHGEVARLKEELAESKKERDMLLQDNLELRTELAAAQVTASEATAKRATAGAEVEVRIREAEDSRDEMEVKLKRTQGDLQQLESTLVDCKLRLAQLKTENEEYKKVIQYYVRHLEVCDPRYIIPLGDRRGIQDLQLADVATRTVMTHESTAERKKRSSIFRRQRSADRDRDGERRGTSDRMRSIRTLISIGRRRGSIPKYSEREGSSPSRGFSGGLSPENTSPTLENIESGSELLTVEEPMRGKSALAGDVAPPKITSQTPRVDTEPLSTSRYRMREGGYSPGEYASCTSTRINQKEFKPSVVSSPASREGKGGKVSSFFFSSKSRNSVRNS